MGCGDDASSVSENPRFLSAALQRKPSLLYLTCHLPFPQYSGGRRRDYELLVRLSKEFTITLCVLSKTFDEDMSNRPAVADLCSHVEVFPVLPGDSRHGPMALGKEARHRSPQASRWVDELVRSGGIDTIHVEGYYLLQHVPEPCPPPVLLVEQNVEFRLLRLEAMTAADQSRRLPLVNLLRETRRDELMAWRRSSLCGAVSEEDRMLMRRVLPGLDVRLTPDGADHLDRERGAKMASIPGTLTGSSIAFIANFGYAPNVDAAFYLCQQIFPTIRAKVPSIHLLLVGNAPPAHLVTLARRTEGVTLVGRVPSVAPYLDMADVIVVPLRIGGGVKVKMLEALRWGKAVVTTSIGVQGINEKGRECVVIRDRPDDFAPAVVSLLGSPARRRSLEQAATRFARNLPTWDEAAARVAECLSELLGFPMPPRRVPVASAVT